MNRDQLKDALKQQIVRVDMFPEKSDALVAELKTAQEALDSGDTARMVTALGQLRIKEAPAPPEAKVAEPAAGSPAPSDAATGTENTAAEEKKA